MTNRKHVLLPVKRQHALDIEGLSFDIAGVKQLACCLSDFVQLFSKSKLVLFHLIDDDLVQPDVVGQWQLDFSVLNGNLLGNHAFPEEQ